MERAKLVILKETIGNRWEIVNAVLGHKYNHSSYFCAEDVH